VRQLRLGVHRILPRLKGSTGARGNVGHGASRDMGCGGISTLRAHAGLPRACKIAAPSPPPDGGERYADC
jgi:hypothetical protein